MNYRFFIRTVARFFFGVFIKLYSKLLALITLCALMANSSFAEGIPLKEGYVCRDSVIYLLDNEVSYLAKKTAIGHKIANLRTNLSIELNREPGKTKKFKACIKSNKATLASLTDCLNGNLTKLIFNQLAGNFSGTYLATPTSDVIPFPAINGTLTLAIG